MNEEIEDAIIRCCLIVLECAINIAMELSHRVDLKIIMAGGSLDKNCFALTGPSGIAAVNDMFYDQAFKALMVSIQNMD
jgi:DeoR/GlpR family transcriptional regulator of sugar metabolism